MCLNTHGLPWFDCVTHWIWHLYISAMPGFFAFFASWVFEFCLNITPRILKEYIFYLMFSYSNNIVFMFTILTVLYQTALFSRVYKSDCFISSSLVLSCLQIWLLYIKQPCFLVFRNLTALYQAALFSHVYKSDCFISSSLVFSWLQIWLFNIKQPCFLVFTNLTALYQAALFSRV